MSNKYSYEYDFDCEVLIRLSEKEVPMIIDRKTLQWVNIFEYKYESYARAIFLGQGCWERLHSISEERALNILKEWGYKEP